MTRRPSDRVVVARALEHLRAGTLASALTERLMEEYSLTPERAKELASRANPLTRSPYAHFKGTKCPNFLGCQ